jgi:protein SCO1/2
MNVSELYQISFPGMKKILYGTAILFILSVANACSRSNGTPPIINNLSKTSFQLINQDSSKVNFTQSLKGKYTLLAFIYTHCPFMCPLITANMAKIQRKLGNRSNVQFVEITFDPKRDTPAHLKKYMGWYKINPRNFTMLTGDSSTIAAVMKAAHIRYFISKRDTTPTGKPQYFFKHTNRIDVLDRKARVRFRYPGSVVSADTVIKDLNRLRLRQNNSVKNGS